MDQSQPAAGNIIAWQNRYKQAGDNRPVFDGYVTKPGSTEELPLALWAHKYADKTTGEERIMLSGTIGRVARNAAAIDQIAAMIADTPAAELALGRVTVAPGQVVLFPNGFKAEAPDKDRPDYWGPINFGDGTPVVRASVWLKQKDGRPYVAGATSFPIPGKSERENQDAAPAIKDLLDSGAVSQRMPDKAKGRAKARAEGRG